MRIRFCFAIALICMLMATGTVASGAEYPVLPLILDGNIHLNGEPAPVGTEITVKLNDEIVGQTEVSLEGAYGDMPQNKLYIVCSPENYKDLKFYVDGIEVQLGNMDLIGNARPGEAIEFNIGVFFVDDDPGAGYTSIQAAVNNANNGDTIVVYPGTYTENVKVDKSVTIMSGNPDDTIVQSANTDNVFYLTADDITISGFTVSGANGHYKAGILLMGSNNNIISNNNVSNNNYGIYLFDINYKGNNSNNMLEDNTVSNNNYGICLEWSNNNTLNNNTASNNNYGIILADSNNNTLSYNAASNNNYGIYLVSSINNMLISNRVNSNNNIGIYLDGVQHNNISFNKLSNNGDGIYLRDSPNNMLVNNNIVNNSRVGVSIESSHAIFSGNIVNSNSEYDIHSSDSNIIFNNYFNNNHNVQLGDKLRQTYIWNITKTEGANIIGGSFLGGNYWANPNGTGFSQTCIDADMDGICDSPYVIDGNNIDYLPLSDMNAEFNPLMYDENSNGGIDKDEIFDAIKDYFNNKITKDDVFEVIMEYFSN